MGVVREIRVAAREPRRFDRLVSFTPEGAAPPATDRTRTALTSLLERRGFRGAEGQRIEGQAEHSGSAVLELRGLGPAATLTPSHLSAHLGRAVLDAAANGTRNLVLVLPAVPAAFGEANAERLLRELAVSGYRFDRFRAVSGEAPTSPAIVVVPPPGEHGTWIGAQRVASVVARATAEARDLANSPPNEATPEWMAERAREIGRRAGARVTVLGPRELARRGMGGILAVGGGSAKAPRLVRVARGRGPLTVALVGKGVTFDSGGLSIKPAAAMDEMKWDKCGACAVLGVVAAAAELDLPIALRAYLPFAENMLGGAAYRPGDIVRCANGKTVEILNTDAEGRMILADALSWAAAESPAALLELSTLTGACVVALGQGAAGLFTPDDDLANELSTASAETGERIWRLPLWPEFLDEMRGSHADLRNAAGRWGGASNAAAFLSQFSAPVGRWAHLDIAGPAYIGGEDRDRRGATGFGVALATRWLVSLAGRAQASRPPRRR